MASLDKYESKHKKQRLIVSPHRLKNKKEIFFQISYLVLVIRITNTDKINGITKGINTIGPLFVDSLIKTIITPPMSPSVSPAANEFLKNCIRFIFYFLKQPEHQTRNITPADSYIRKDSYS